MLHKQKKMMVYSKKISIKLVEKATSLVLFLLFILGAYDTLKLAQSNYFQTQIEVTHLDKYEYNLKMDQMKAFLVEGKYEDAVEIADTN